MTDADASLLEKKFASALAAVAERDGVIAALKSSIASLQGTIAALQTALVNHANENEILKRRLFGTKSERGGTSEMQLLLGDLLSQQTALQQQLDALAEKADEEESPPASTPPDKEKARPKGRRDLSVSTLPKVLVEIRDEELEKTAKLIDWEISHQLMYARGGFRVLVKKLAKYEVIVGGEATILGTPSPRTLFPRGMLHSSALAWIVVQKFALGVPHYRLEQHMAAQGESIDRSTMSRNVEEVGNTLGATIVHAMMRNAIESCGVLSTDATGAAIQPPPREGGAKQACKKGHFFTIVADCDHVLFVYAERHTQEAVANIFRGFHGYLQSDASSVYDILERGPPVDSDQGIALVGCFAHARRYFFEAAVCKYAVGVEGLTRLRAVYAADNTLKNLPPADRKRKRDESVVPLVDDFFAWAHRTARATPGRNLATKALGYVINQEQELRRVFLDGRLPLDNTRSERALRKVVVGRKNWMFYGSDLHADAAAAIFSVVASCRLHKLDPEQYLDEVLRVLPYWPEKRYLELAPKYWAATRERLDPGELDLPLGEFTVPPVVSAASALGAAGFRPAGR